jgi:D-alanyl-D-alanine carboxypeptidase
LKAAQLLERGFNSASGLSWFMTPFGTVESLQPIAAAPPNLREEMCGGHRKRPATEDEDDLIPNNPESPYAVFLASLRPAKAKGAAPLREMGEPVLVYTGTKPPAPGSQASTESKPEKKKKTAVIKPAAAKDKDGEPAASTAKPKRKSTTDSASVDAPATKPKPKTPAPKEAAKDDAAAAAAASGDATAAKPKPKKPSPNPPPMTITSPAEPSSQTR